MLLCHSLLCLILYYEQGSLQVDFAYGIRSDKHKTSACFINSHNAWPLKKMSRCYNTKENWKMEALNTWSLVLPPITMLNIFL